MARLVGQLAPETKAADAKHGLDVDQLERETLRLRGLIADLRGALAAKLSDRPVESVASWFADSQIEAAEAKLRRNYRFISRLFSTLWELGRLHHATNARGEEDVCCCPAGTKCEVLALIADWERPVRDWESKQVSRLRDGLEHDLPLDHPALRGRDRYGIGDPGSYGYQNLA